MTRNTWKTTWRFMQNNPTFTVINLTGLTAGLTVSFFLLVYVINEFSYNSFHRDSQRIYRIITGTREGSLALSPLRVAPAIQHHTSGVLNTGSLVFLPFLTGPVSVRQTDGVSHEQHVICADPEILDILTIPLIYGSKSNSLNETRIMLSRSAALACFGTEDPVGRPVEMVIAGLPLKLTVSAVFEDFPWNSTIKADYILGMAHFYTIMHYFDLNIRDEIATCTDLYAESYLLTSSSFSPDDLESAMPALLDSLSLSEQEISFTLQSIRDIYLSTEQISNDIHAKGDKESLLYYGLLALFIVLLAGINYAILSTARAAMRYREIGIRKILGAGRALLRREILLESMALTFLSFPLSFLVLGILEPFLDALLGYDVRLYTWNMLIYIPLFLGITLLIGFASGWYIASYLSSLHPLKAVQNKLMLRRRFSGTRVFITFQLFIILTMLICVTAIFRQLRYCLNSEVSIEAANLVIVPFNPNEFSRYTDLRDTLMTFPCFVSVSGSSNPPPSTSSVMTAMNTMDSVGESIDMEIYSVDANYFQTLGVPVVNGSDFLSLPADTGHAPIIFNETALRSLNIDPDSSLSRLPLPVMGVVADFHTHSLYSPILPSLYQYNPVECNALVFRHQPEKQAEALQRLRGVWKTLAPDLVLTYRTYPGALRELYSREQTFAQIILSFAVLAFLITGMGLFGVAILIAERSAKEVAIRKVYGAPAPDILFRMQKEFLLYLAIATLPAILSAWALIHYWLSAFHYKTTVGWPLYAGAILFVALFISLIMLSRSYRLLRKPPARTLKYE